MQVEKEWERGYDWGSEYETMKGCMLLNIAWLHCGLMSRLEHVIRKKLVNFEL